jgi:hypothetical protein
MANATWHGHQSDRFVVDNAVFSRMVEWVFKWKNWTIKKRLVRYLDRLNTQWLRLTSKVILVSHSQVNLRL